MAQMGFFINSAVCSGCKACELACKDKHSFDVGPRNRQVREVCGGGWTQDESGAWAPQEVYSYAVSFSCGHCDVPACFGVCPSGAISKDEATGIVSIDPEVCIGCGSCAMACPYGAPQKVESAKLTYKCDMCKDLLDAGEEPACVAICPQRALAVGDIEELRRQYGEVRDVVPLPDSSATEPNVVIAPHRDARFEVEDDMRALSLYGWDGE